MPNSNPSPTTPSTEPELRLDRPYLAARNQAILDQLAKRKPVQQIAAHFGLSRNTVQTIARNARTKPNADITYFSARYALPYHLNGRSK